MPTGPMCRYPGKMYADLVVDFIELLPPHMVIHRLTGDPHADELVAPEWCLDKTAVLNQIKENFITATDLSRPPLESIPAFNHATS